jgi:hypothetical protein
MKESPSGKPNLRVIEGGKKELKTLPRNKEASDPRRANIELVRKLSPSLDSYLSQRPTDREERMRLLFDISQELWKLPAGGADAGNAALKRNREKLGERPRHAHANFTWRDTTDEQLDWDEQFALEHANAVAEKIHATFEQQRKIDKLEDDLSDAVARHYAEDNSNLTRDE